MIHRCKLKKALNSWRPIGITRLAIVIAAYAFFEYGHVQTAQSKPLRLELASAFHPADPMFGKQLQNFFGLMKTKNDGTLKLRSSRKTRGASASQIVDLIKIRSIDGALLDPIQLGYRPAMAQIFGGIPFGPTALQILEWSGSPEGRTHITGSFGAIGVHPLICGHRESLSGVFARDKFVWPAPAQQLTVHSRGLANGIYQGLKIPARPLHGADLYMGYATGVVDLMVSLNPPIDARAGYAQVSRYFYYPSWERRSAFAFLLINDERWRSFSKSNRGAIEKACETLNSQPLSVDMAGAIAQIASQGAEDTVVEPWPTPFLTDARALWVKSSTKTLEQHPSLAPAFRALNIPGEAPPTQQ